MRLFCDIAYGATISKIEKSQITYLGGRLSQIVRSFFLRGRIIIAHYSRNEVDAVTIQIDCEN